jgi:PEP-CTERM motif-containing protein
VGSPGVNELDFYSYMLREFGRELGLGLALQAGPNADPLSVMNPNIAAGTQSGPFTARDIAALQELYGTPEPSTWMLFALGLGVLGVVLKFRGSGVVS